MRSEFAGKLADAFLTSKLTPLLLGAALALGLYTVVTMPSEEEPQIIVPLADIHLPLPGATPEEIENRLLIPMENILSGIEGVEYVYSHAEYGYGLVTVRYQVGRDMEASLVRLYSTLMKYADRMPPGFSMPLVKTVTIDDVPFFSLTLTGGGYDHAALRALADELRVALEAVPEVRDVSVIGGYPREIRVQLSPDRMAAFGVDPAMIAERLRLANLNIDAGRFTKADEVVRVTAGPFLTSARDVGAVVLDVREGRLVQVSDVAAVIDGPEEISNYTFHGAAGGPLAPMVTIAASKRPGADATQLGRALEAKIESLHGRLLPNEVEALITRNYGETAREKVTTLKAHLLLAILAVGLVVALAMGWRSAVIVMISVPITFALTLFVYQFFGYTLNRVTLFALIFVTGIVIDDSIIVAENMHRHFAMRDRPLRAAARAAVDEVGNPTILATLTVIAAVLPMLFVSGLMGPYMSPMPIGATVAMLFSLAVALVGTPWLAYRLLRGAHAEGAEPAYVLERTRIYRVYNKVMSPLLRHPTWMWGMLGTVTVLLLAATAMFFTRAVAVKMLPFDDKNEMQIIIDLPEHTPLEATTALAEDMSLALAEVPEISDLQLYVGTAAPFNFNGMIRHYYLRRGNHVAYIQVNLVDKSERGDQSHDIAKRVRPVVQRVARESGLDASVKVVEVPPGPPVLSTLVAEVYGPDEESQLAVARRVRELFAQHPSVVDIDWSLADPQREIRFHIDEEKSALSGVAKASLAQSLRIALGGAVATHLSQPTARTLVPVRLRLEEGARSGIDRLGVLHVASAARQLIPLSELVRTEIVEAPQVLDRKNGQRVIYVTAEVAGAAESPVYAILDLKKQIGKIELPSGSQLGQLYTHQPGIVEQPVMKWDGEWQVTYEVFRDLGIAFAGALLLIYVLIVAWFGSLVAPLVMMTAIPLTLVGIAPGHWMFGAFFTATSMIGMIALAGIMVRNGILLIDYLEARRSAGAALEQAVIEAGAVRTRPIALTAGTVVIGAIVILFDPIFEGLAVSLITGAVASTLLTLIVVPSIYYLVHRARDRRAARGQTIAAADSAVNPEPETT